MKIRVIAETSIIQAMAEPLGLKVYPCIGNKNQSRIYLEIDDRSLPLAEVLKFIRANIRRKNHD